MIIKKKESLKDIKREWEAHQLKNDPFFYTRRELIEKGILTGISSYLFPTLSSSLLLGGKEAVAANPPPVNYVHLVFRGGMGCQAVGVALDKNGSFLPDSGYQSHGWLGISPNQAGAINTQFGAPLWAMDKVTQILSGASAKVLSNLQCATIFTERQDDSDTNPDSNNHLVPYNAGKMGFSTTLKSIIGDNSLPSGVRTAATGYVPGFTPVAPRSVTDINALFNISGPLATRLNATQREEIIKMQQKLDVGLFQRVLSWVQGELMGNVLSEGANQTIAGIKNPVTINAASLTPFIPNPSTPTALNARDAAAIQAVLDGHSIGCGISRGGFDYHDGSAGWDTALTGQHAQAGTAIVQVAESFALNDRSVLIHVTTDGSIRFDPTNNTNGAANANGDGGISTVHFLFALAFGGTPKLVNFQRGAFFSGGGADNTTVIAKNPAYVGLVALSTWIGMCGRDPAQYAPPGILASDFAKLDLTKLGGPV